MAQDRLRCFAMAGRAVALFYCIFVDRKSRRIDPYFDEQTVLYVAFDYIGRNLKLLAVLGMHANPID